MKRIAVTSICLILFSCISYAQVTKILFLGNSYTATNNLPERVSKIASSLGDSVYYDSNTPGGYRLLNHVTNAITLAKISQDDWDYVVLQAQSQEPSWHPSQVTTEVLPYAAILNDSIKSNNACTETILYMTWGRKYGDQQNCASWPPVCTFLGMQERLMTGYMTMAAENGATVAPVGLSWKQSMDNDPDSLINLYSPDNSHPSLRGTYLSACVFYATIFQKSPFGSNYTAGLSENEALFLQQIAEDVVLSDEYNFTFFDNFTNIEYDLGWKNWFDTGNIAIAGFTTSNVNNNYNFYDNSLNADTYLWDFGDGNSSSLQNPMNTYIVSGEYVVTQTIINPCFEDAISDTINVLLNSSEEVLDQNIIQIYPNPGTGIFNLIFSTQEKYDHISYKVYNTLGELVDENTTTGKSRNSVNQINLSTCQKGLYYLQIYLDKDQFTKVLIVN